MSDVLTDVFFGPAFLYTVFFKMNDVGQILNMARLWIVLGIAERHRVIDLVKAGYSEKVFRHTCEPR